MKKMIAKIAVTAALVLPGFASAATDTDSFSFSLSNALSDVSILSTWVDQLVFSGNTVSGESASPLGWTLTRGNSTVRSATITETAGSLAGASAISIDGLTAGSYTLTLSGTWSAPTANTLQGGSVNLFDGDRIAGGGRETNTFNVTAVPEPETYAMLLAGLMMMGTIARRRRQS